jgi:hypothetical protein
MKKNRLGIIGMGLMAMATLATPASLAEANTPVSQTVSQSNSKAIQPIKERKGYHQKYSIGGLDMVQNGVNYGLSPKEYGQKFGCTNHNKKSNKLRVKHNYKVKRRSV